MSASATFRVRGGSDFTSSSSCLYDIINGEDGVTMPMDAVKDEMVQDSWKIDSPLVKVKLVEILNLPMHNEMIYTHMYVAFNN